MSNTDTNNYPQQSVVSENSNKWLPYFGQPQFPLQTNANANTSFARYDLPVAYKGQNLYLGETINSFILDQADKDFTSVILPITKTDNLHIQWNEWKFDTPLVGRTPEEGTSRLIRSSMSEYSDRLVRRGIAFSLEHGFMNTEKGRQQYVRNIQEIVKATQLTMSLDVLSALLTCKRFNIQWEKEHGYFQQRIGDIMKREVDMFGIVQLDPNGFDIVLEQEKKRMGRYNVSPDALIIPSTIQLYIPMVSPEKTDYMLRGEKGPAGFDAGAITTFRGTKIFESRPYNLNDGELPINMLSSTEQIGQYNVMSCEDNVVAAQYKSSNRDIMIFDANTDNFRRISFLEAMKHTFRFDASGNLSDHHSEFAQKLRSGSSATDLFLYKNNDYDNEYRVVDVFGQMHTDSAHGLDFLPKDVIHTVADTITRDISADDLEALQEGLGVISQLQAMTSGSDTSTTFSWGDAGYGDSWKSLDNVISSSDPRAVEVRATLNKFKSAFRVLYRHLVQVLPESHLLETSATWIETLYGNSAGTAEERGLMNLYANVFAKKFDRVAFSQESVGGDIYATVGAKHDMNTSALQTSGAIDVKSYHAAADKYASDNEMYGKVVHGVSHLIKKHKADLNHPDFVSSYKMLDKVSGLPKKDMKVLERMGVNVDVPAASVSWTDSPVSWSKWWEAKPNAKRVVHESLEGVDAESDDFTKSLVFAQMNAGSATTTEVASESAEVGKDWGPFSRKSKKVASVGAAFAESHDTLYSAKDADFKQFTDDNMKKRYAHCKKIAHAGKRIAALAFLMTKVNMTTFETMHAHNVHIPVDIMLSRPFMSFEMYHAILCKAGRETGATYVNAPNFMLGDNVQSKLHEGHFTFYAKSVVSDSKNVSLMKNIFINAYKGGFNTDFYDWENGVEDKSDPMYSELNRPSIFAMMIPAASNIKSNPVDIRSEFPYYSHVLQFETLSEPNFDQEFFTPNEVSGGNPIIYRGMQYAYDAEKRTFSKLTTGTGHLGRDIYSGVRSVWDGGLKYVEKQHYKQQY